MVRTTDLNCDLGEGAGHDAELMPLITSANIACGGHAGDEATMRATIKLAQAAGVDFGAHPSFIDRANFGRTELTLPPSQIKKDVELQIRVLASMGRITHVKPHGALYNLAARDAEVAKAVVAAVLSVDPGLLLFGLSGGLLVKKGRAAGLRVVSEVFADRTYQPDGSLTPRSQPNAMVTDAQTCLAQAIRFVTDGKIRAVGGEDISVKADTICLHGDGPHAVEFALALRTGLQKVGIRIMPARLR